jgi:nucleoid DNA-binding protein
MDELIKLVSQKAGISPDQAKMAVTTVLGFIKQKLPTPVAAQIDGILQGGTPDLSKGLGGLFGK